MKKLLSLVFALSVLAAAAVNFTGCASMEAHSTESLLSAAGFRTVTPATPPQMKLYNALPPFEVQRMTRKGKVFYAYADKTNAVIYLGGEAAYQRYKQLGLQKSIAEDQLMAAEMNEESAMDWDTWGGWGVWD
jgi:hypothetical protein